MNLNDDSYLYIRQVADQIEGLTCALTNFIEKAGCELESYHYEAFNRFSNEIRSMAISVSKEIKDEFAGIEEAIEESAIRIRASESSISRLKIQLADTEDVFSRLVTHSENIQEFHSDTSNPYIPNATEEVYRVFSGYDRFLDQYQVSRPDENNPISTLMYSFFCTVSSLFERLFRQYDSLLQGFGADVEEKRRNLAALMVIKKREGREDITKAAVGVAKTAAFAALGIKKKNAFDVVESGIGFIAKISETLEGLDKLKYAKPKKSVARNIIKGIAAYNNTVELTGGIISAIKEAAGASGTELGVSTLTKFVLAAPIAVGGAEKLEEWSDSGKLDVIVSALGMVESGAGFASAARNALAPGTGMLAVIRAIPDLGSSGLGLVEKAAKYVNKKYEKEHAKADKKIMILQELGAHFKAYNKEVEEYKRAKERKLIAVRKPKAPPFITAQGIFDKLKKGIDCIEEGSEVVEYIKGIL